MTLHDVMLKLALSIAKAAPPSKEAEFEFIVQTDNLTVECASAQTAPPD